MDDFKIIYKILAILSKHKGDEGFDYSLISASAMKTEYNNWEQILIELQTNGYIRGVLYTQSLSDKFPHIVEPIRPVITITGMEYLAENSIMKKLENTLKTLGEFIP